MITLPSLQKLNLEQGYQADDDYVVEVATILNNHPSHLENTKLFRIAGGSIAAIFGYDKEFVMSSLN